jgi:hypothetical protein
MVRMGDFFGTERLRLETTAGELVVEFSGTVSTSVILVEDPSLPAEDGQVVVRALPNGKVHRLIIEDAKFFPGMTGMAAHFQLKYRKESAPHAASLAPTYNVSGPNARVNTHSHDASTSLHVSPETMFAEMIRDTREQIRDEAQVTRVLAAIDDLRQNSGKPSYSEAYFRFMGIAADHLAVFQAYLPALAQLLGAGR